MYLQIIEETDEWEMLKTKELLLWLGVTPKYHGFHITSYAVLLCVRQPKRLLLITKWLYPDMAKHFHTGWQNIERNIRTVAEIIWTSYPEKLEQIAMRKLDRRPSNQELIAILAEHIASQTTDDT